MSFDAYKNSFKTERLTFTETQESFQQFTQGTHRLSIYILPVPSHNQCYLNFMGRGDLIAFPLHYNRFRGFLIELFVCQQNGKRESRSPTNTLAHRQIRKKKETNASPKSA